MQRPEVWARLEIKIDKDEVISRLLEVRDIRNDVMHFDPEPLTPEEKQKLNRMEAFLRQAFI
jgi:hypothetical protein